MRAGRGIALLLICSLPVVAFAQSPWVRSKAGFYAQAAWQFIPAYDAVYPDNNVSGTTPLHRKISEATFQLYGEYGITRRTTLTIALPLRFLRSGQTIITPLPDGYAAGTLVGIGNVSLSLRRTLHTGKITLAGTVRLDAPTNINDAEPGLRAGYNAFTCVPMLNAGRGFRHAYVFAYAGYGLRTNGYNDFLHAGLEGGWHFKKWWLTGFSELNLPLANTGDADGPPMPRQNLLTHLYVNNQGYLSIGLKSQIELHRFYGIALSAAGAAWGRNVPAQPAFSAGIYFKWE